MCHGGISPLVNLFLLKSTPTGVRTVSFDLLSGLLTFAERHQSIWDQKQEGGKCTKFLLPFISSAFEVRQGFHYVLLSFLYFFFFFFLPLKLLSSILCPTSWVLASLFTLWLLCKTFFSTSLLEFLCYIKVYLIEAENAILKHHWKDLFFSVPGVCLENVMNSLLFVSVICCQSVIQG